MPVSIETFMEGSTNTVSIRPECVRCAGGRWIAIKQQEVHRFIGKLGHHVSEKAIRVRQQKANWYIWDWGALRNCPRQGIQRDAGKQAFRLSMLKKIEKL